MRKRRRPSATAGKSRPRTPRRVRLPAFLIDEDIGLGDVIGRLTYAMGIAPCGGCRKRAAALNEWIQFSRKP
jgi:hypothetical protein